MREEGWFARVEVQIKILFTLHEQVGLDCSCRSRLQYVRVLSAKRSSPGKPLGFPLILPALLPGAQAFSPFRGQRLYARPLIAQAIKRSIEQGSLEEHTAIKFI